MKRRGVRYWRAQWRENGRGRTRILGRCADLSRAEARALLDRILDASSLRQAQRAKSPLTFRRFVLDEYLPAKSRVWKRSTEQTNEQLIRDYILAGIGDIPLPVISRRQLQDELDRLAARGLSRSIVARVRFQLSAIFRMAASDGLITVNPAEGLIVPRCAPPSPKRTISVQEIQRAERALELRDRLIFRLAACEGLRPGEIAGLQVGDLTSDGLRIERRVYRRQLDSPKSHRSRRLVPLTGGTRELLEAYLDQLVDNSPGAWLFPSETLTTPIDPSNVWRRRIAPALRAAGIKGVNFQVLRRTWVTQLAEAERDARIRAQIAGHGVDVHENVYRQPDAEALKRAMRRLERRLQ